MQATLDRDIIIKLGKGPVTLPDNWPRNVGLDRLRWNGDSFVDLARLSGFWVEYKDGFILHCREYPGCTFIEMPYKARKRLILNGGTPRLQTPAETDAKESREQLSAARNQLARLLEKQQSIYELLAFLLGWIAVLALHARTTDTVLKEQLNTKLDNNLSAFLFLPITKMLQNSNVKLDTIKLLLEAFYSKTGD